MTEDNKQEKIGRPKLQLKKTFDLGKIKQSFSHGRSRSVSVEVKKKRVFSNTVNKISDQNLEDGKKNLDHNRQDGHENNLNNKKSNEIKDTKEQKLNPKNLNDNETKDFRKKQNNKPNAQEKTQEVKEDKNTKLTNFKLIKVPKKLNERRKGKLTISEALDENTEKVRSLAAVKRAREKAKLRLSQKPENRDLQKEKKKREIIIPDFIAVNDLGSRLAEKNSDIIKILMKLGVMATINQTIDGDTAELVVIELGHTPKRVSDSDVEIGLSGHKDDDSDLQPRSPVVTIMGHVDHGKTSLLDAIREKKVTQSEAGGITQHIGAYRVEGKKGSITFLDTPGHAAFSQMRARGSNVTDIIILVVAADDSVKDQTIEAISHAKAAKCPIIVAINKIDTPNSNPAKVESDLMSHGIVSEKMGGEILMVELSAKTKVGIDKLMEAITLQSELLELKSNPSRDASGTVIESKIDTGRGPVISVLVQKGKLKVGDIVIAGKEWGKVRALSNDEGKRINEALPSFPVEVLGLSGAPSSGDEFVVVDSEARAREVTQYRDRMIRLRQNASVKRGTVEQMLSTANKDQEHKEFPVIVKADVHGSKEAIEQSLQKIQIENFKVKILHSGVGEINESDVSLASASSGLILGFNVRSNLQAKNLSKRDNVSIKYFSIIYEVIDEVEKSIKSHLEPEIREDIIGNVKVKKIFGISKTLSIAGCEVLDGKVTNNCEVKIIREGEIIFQTTVESLRREKNEVKDVNSGTECGIKLKNFNEFKEDDILQCYLSVKVK